MTTQPRLSNPGKLVPEFGPVTGALFKAGGNRSVGRSTVGPVQLRVGQSVGDTAPARPARRP